MVGCIEITFLGTGSCYPSPSRGASSLILRLDGECWMFDCGEGTQIQYQRSHIKPGRLTKIFITHLHGDHLFGLPGLMCLVQGLNADEDNTLHLYGPVGLARFIRTSLILSGTELIRPYKVHEIDIDGAGLLDSTTELHTNELESEVISIEHNKFQLFENDKVVVQAGILKHKISCVGFVITERDTVGALNVNLLKEFNVKPGPLYGRLKSGMSITASDGTEIHPHMVIGENKKGRKIVILGDTNDTTLMEDLCRSADVVVHEATHQDELQEKAITYGHSTPSMAAQFCEKINARTLILNHFSQRYFDDEESCKSDDGLPTSYLVRQAERPNLTVLAARDFYTFQVLR